MNRVKLHRYFIRKNLVVMIGIFLCVYFSYHAVQGQRSFLQLMHVRTDIGLLEQEREALVAERQALEQRVVMLRPGTINKDFLEERVRYVLGYRRAEEFAVVGHVSFSRH